MDEDPIDAFKVLSLTTSTTRRVLTAQVAGVGSEGADATAERFDGVEVAQPAGLMASPALTATTEALAVRRGDELIALFLIDKGATVQALAAGETKLHGVNATNAGTVVHIRASGAIDITSANNGAVNISAHGTGDVVVNGGSLKVARATDPVSVTLTALQIGAITAPAGGGPCTGGPITLAGTIDTGAGAGRMKA